MQRKVFYRAGAPILATRGDGFFETVGTLQQLIEEGRQQQRDLQQWLEVAELNAAAAPEPEEAKAAPEPLEPALLVGPVAAPLQTEPEGPSPKRPRQKRRRPEPVTEDTIVAEPSQEAEVDVEEVAVAPLLPTPSCSLRRTVVRAPAAAAETPGQDRGKRWLMAGAARRGRAGKHWSTRQR